MNDVRPIDELGDSADYKPSDVDPTEPASWPTLGEQAPPVEADPVDWVDQQVPVADPFGDDEDGTVDDDRLVDDSIVDDGE